jgi:glycosyltransferase involved in cell wall biosynthesis
MIPTIINNGVNGYISNDENQLRSYIEILMQDESKRIEIGANARQTILDNFSEENFIKKWQEIFDITYEVSRT